MPTLQPYAAARRWNQLARELSAASSAADTLPVRNSVSAKGRLVSPLRRSVELFDRQHEILLKGAADVDDVDDTLVAALGRARSSTAELLDEARGAGPRPGRPGHVLATIERDGGKLAPRHRQRIVGDLSELLLDVQAMRDRALGRDSVATVLTTPGTGMNNPATGWVPIR